MDLSLFNCDDIDNLDEGVEVAVGSNGDWIPLAFYSPNLKRTKKDINLGEDIINPTTSSLNIRGYEARLVLSLEPGPHTFSLRVCDTNLINRDNLKFRWLHSTFYDGTAFPYDKDVWTLDDVQVIVHFNGARSKTLLMDDFNSSFK